MLRSVRRFACTQCGKCCDRSPEVELSEAAALADIFVFRLMFRIYSLPRVFDGRRADTPQIFYEKKRLLNAQAARTSRRKGISDGKAVDHVDYLMISALSLNTTQGSCSALASGRCSIYPRRPLACRTVPFHYARGGASAARDLDGFVATPGYRCDVSDAAPVVLEGGTIVAPYVIEAREEASCVAEQDRSWRAAIVRSMKTSSDESLPRLEEVEANARLAATTTSMRVAWQIAVDAGLMAKTEFVELVETQLTTIERQLENDRADTNERLTLREMKSEYRRALAAEQSFVEDPRSARR